MNLLKAKDTIFRMIGQYHYATRFQNDDALYITTYNEDALQNAFATLGIEGDRINLMEFCNLWEDNNRAIWAQTNPDTPYTDLTAVNYYNQFANTFNQLLELTDEKKVELL